MVRSVFVRFVLSKINSNTGIKDGVFGVAYEAFEEGDLSDYEREVLGDLLTWFEHNLEVPKRFNRTKSKGYYRRATKGVSWFKASARRHVSKMYRLAAILRDLGHNVTLIRTSNPGYLIYEDSQQGVAEPFNDLRD